VPSGLRSGHGEARRDGEFVKGSVGWFAFPITSVWQSMSTIRLDARRSSRSTGACAGPWSSDSGGIRAWSHAGQDLLWLGVSLQIPRSHFVTRADDRSARGR
jgi:hypothetical protein